MAARQLLRAVGALQWVGLLAILGLALHFAIDDSGGVSWFFDHVVYYGIEVIALLLAIARAIRGPHRSAWIAISIAIGSYVAGEFLWLWLYSGDENYPYPSIADVLYLGFFPPVYVGIALLLRARARRAGAGLWIDGVSLACAAGALASAILIDAVLDTTEGSRSAVLTNLAYPLGDVFLLALIVGGFSLTGWRPDRSWLLVAAALVVFALGDSVYLFQTAQGTYVEGTLLDLTWPTALFLIAAAGWRTEGPPRSAESVGRALLVAPAICFVVAVSVLTLDHFRNVNLLALALAVCALGGVVVRLALEFRENGQLLRDAVHDSVTDPVTGLGNRRRLVAELAQAADEATLERPWMLVIFDLDGFKGYNDAFGHPAGDELLGRLGSKLAQIDGVAGVAGYRLGGDEFCLLAPVAGVDVERLIHLATYALSEKGVGFDVGCSFGAVHLPEEADDPVSALRLADERLYAQKHAKKSKRDQPHDVLLQVLLEREPSLHTHTLEVGSMARDVGLALGLEGRDLDELHRAAQLHDIGKLAIPDAILHKPTSLEEAEWRFIAQHTVVGERILAASPFLRRIGEIVRSTHERWDGTGYPDRLTREQIPLAARVICACDALDAMTRTRPYSRALELDEAVAELERCAGTQFDPEVVEALVRCVRLSGLRRRADAPESFHVGERGDVADHDERGRGKPHREAR
jgi:two-component system cell cycle response regulator